MSVISLICFTVFFILLISSFSASKDFLAPARVFGMVWSLVLGLVELKVSRLQLQWNVYDWFMVTLAIMTFLIGIYFSMVLNIGTPILLVNEIRERIKKISIDDKFLFRFIIGYFIVWLICFLLQWWIEGYLPIFTAEPSKARLKFKVFGINYIINSVNVILFLVIQYLILVREKIKEKVILVTIFIISLGDYILIVQRYGLFIFLMMAFGFYYYAGTKIKLSSIFAFLIFLIGLVIGIESLRESKLVIGFMILNAKTKLPIQYSVFVLPYMYVAMNLENFVKYYSQITHYAYGFHSFGFFVDGIGIGHWIAEYFSFSKFKLYISGYNTYPFYWSYFLDFGIAGLALIPCLLGFFISEVYYHFRRNPTLTTLTIYAIAFAVMVISYSSDPLTRLDTMLPFIILISVQTYIVKHSSEKIST